MTDSTATGLREQVRDRYAAAASAVRDSAGPASCCPAPVETDDRFGSILYTQLDRDAAGRVGGGQFGLREPDRGCRPAPGGAGPGPGPGWWDRRAAVSTRNISAITFGLSTLRLITQLEITTSTASVASPAPCPAGSICSSWPPPGSSTPTSATPRRSPTACTMRSSRPSNRPAGRPPARPPRSTWPRSKRAGRWRW